MAVWIQHICLVVSNSHKFGLRSNWGADEPSFERSFQDLFDGSSFAPLIQFESKLMAI